MPGTEPSFRTLAQQAEKQPPCQAHCANSGDVRGWMGVIAQHEKNGLTREQAFDEAWRKIALLNPLPATIARICPHPCEDSCIRRDKDGAVSINALERFLGDWALSRTLPLPLVIPRIYEESIGVIGSGPASLSFAYQMARRGYGVTVYERGESMGGMLRRAIPEYRLPHDVLDAEVERLLNVGITLVNNTDVGSTIGFEELRDRHGVLFLGLGAQAARRLGFRFEGVFYKHMIFKGKNRDTAWYSILDDEWPEVRAILENWLDDGNFDDSGQARTSLSESMAQRKPG